MTSFFRFAITTALLTLGAHELRVIAEQEARNLRAELATAKREAKALRAELALFYGEPPGPEEHH